VLRQIDGMEKKTIESQVSSHLTERFQWPLALAVAALLLHLAVAPFAPGAAVEMDRPARPEETRRRRVA
jgi:ABC-type spermidine/putrescine transport system permease subunit I